VRKPFYGVLLVPTLVLAIYAGQHASPYDMARPLLGLTSVVGAVFLIVGTLTRRWHAAAMLVAFATIAIFAVELLMLAVAYLAFAWLSARRTGSWNVAPRLTYPLNAFIATWFAIACGVALTVSLPTQAAVPIDVSVVPGPNVYLIWLDAYPREDTLLEYFGFDNAPFLRELEERGCTVSHHSTSQYPSTSQTMATMLQGRPLDELLGAAWNGSHEQHRYLWQLINDAPIPGAYEAAGYTTYSIVSPAPGHDWRTADVVLDSPWLSDFEAHLFSHGVLRFVLPFHAMHRADMLDAFRYLEESAGRSPRFVFAHIMKPHDPYVFAADGSPADPCGNECRNHAGPPNATLGDRLIGQIEWLNARLLSALDRIISADGEATVIVFSDHGLRRDRSDMDEWFRTLFAARNHDFPDDVALRDLFTGLVSLESSTAR
jgi:hypothetical protein